MSNWSCELVCPYIFGWCQSSRSWGGVPEEGGDATDGDIGSSTSYPPHGFVVLNTGPAGHQKHDVRSKTICKLALKHFKILMFSQLSFKVKASVDCLISIRNYEADKSSQI